MKKINLFTGIMILFVACSFTRTNLQKDNEKISVSCSIDKYVSNQDYELKIKFNNISSDTVIIPWSTSNIFLSNDTLPKLTINLIDTSTQQTYVMKNNQNGINLDYNYTLISIAPKSEHIERINMKLLFGKSIPTAYDLLYVKYENSRSTYGEKKVFTGKVYSNKEKVTMK